MTPEEDRVADSLVALSKLTKLRQRDRTGSAWSEEYRSKGGILDKSVEKLVAHMDDYLAHKINKKDTSKRALEGFGKAASDRMTDRMDPHIPPGPEGTPVRKAVLGAIREYAFVTSGRKLNEFSFGEVDKDAVRKDAVRESLNGALTRSAETHGLGDQVKPFSTEEADFLRSQQGLLQHHVFNTVTSASSLFEGEQFGSVSRETSFNAALRTQQIADTERELVSLSHSRAPTPYAAEQGANPDGRRDSPGAGASRAPLKRAADDEAGPARATPVVEAAGPGLARDRSEELEVRPVKRLKQSREVQPLTWEEQRLRLRSAEAGAVERTPPLRRLNRPRVRDSEQVEAAPPTHRSRITRSR